MRRVLYLSLYKLKTVKYYQKFNVSLSFNCTGHNALNKETPEKAEKVLQPTKQHYAPAKILTMM